MSKRYADTKINPSYYGKVTINDDSNPRRTPDCERNWLKGSLLRLASWIDNGTTYVRSNDLCAAGWVVARAIERAVNGETGYLLVNRDHMHRLLGVAEV